MLSFIPPFRRTAVVGFAVAITAAPLVAGTRPSTSRDPLAGPRREETALRAHRVVFAPGQSTLGASAEETLRAVVEEAKRRALEDVSIFAFADRLRPRDESLPEPDRRLARERGRSVRRFLDEALTTDLQTHNMAEKANGFSRLFDTVDAEAKNSAPETRMAKLVRAEGKPGTVVVVLRYDDVAPKAR